MCLAHIAQQGRSSFFLTKGHNSYWEWFAGHKCTTHNKWYKYLPKLLCNFYSINIIYKCGGGLKVYGLQPLTVISEDIF